VLASEKGNLESVHAKQVPLEIPPWGFPGDKKQESVPNPRELAIVRGAASRGSHSQTFRDMFWGFRGLAIKSG